MMLYRESDCEKFAVKYDEIVQMALSMRHRAYAPYSGFVVGAGLLAKSGRIYGGCNIENAAFSPTNCAERTAFFKAVSEGERDFCAIAIAGGALDAETLDYCAPCGVCRQVMMEFCDPESFRVVLAKSETEYRVYTLAELLPVGFGAGNFKRP